MKMRIMETVTIPDHVDGEYLWRWVMQKWPTGTEPPWTARGMADDQFKQADLPLTWAARETILQ